MRHHEVVLGVGPETRDTGSMRGRAGRPRPRFWTPGRVTLLLATAIGLPWLPALDLPQQVPPLYRARGRGPAPIRRLAFRPDGRALATIDEGGRVQIRPAVEGGDRERELDVGGFARAACFSPDGRYLAIGRDEPDILLCDLDRDGRGHLLGIPVRMTSDVRFSPDGRTLVVSSYDSGAILLWDLEAGRPRMILAGRSSSVTALAFAPDGRSLASAGSAGIVLWDLASGRPHHDLGGSQGYFPSLIYSPDGRLLAAVNIRESSAGIWDVGTGRRLRRITARSFQIHSAAFSPDGRLLATAAGDGFASLWGVADGRELLRLDGQSQYLRHIGFAPDGRTLAATANDEDIRLWDLNGVLEEKPRP
jgi:WD40 repeat protein